VCVCVCVCVAEKRERQMTGLHCYTEAYEKSDPLDITSKKNNTVFRRDLFHYALFDTRTE
jgi:hypothetical protein